MHPRRRTDDMAGTPLAIKRRQYSVMLLTVHSMFERYGSGLDLNTNIPTTTSSVLAPRSQSPPYKS